MGKTHLRGDFFSKSSTGVAINVVKTSDEFEMFVDGEIIEEDIELRNHADELLDGE